MASAIIHLCVANEVNKIIKKNEKEFLLGSIAPDISKIVGEDRNVSHFKEESSETPDLDKFLNKYQNSLKDNDFNLGYYCHLFTDLVWFGIFMKEFRDLDDSILKYSNGEIKNLDQNTIMKVLYNDYTNLNVAVIDSYNMDLSLFYEDYPKISSEIDEIPIDKLPLLIDKMGIIIEESKERPTIVFDTSSVNRFIDKTVIDFIDNLKELGIINDN